MPIFVCHLNFNYLEKSHILPAPAKRILPLLELTQQEVAFVLPEKIYTPAHSIHYLISLWSSNACCSQRIFMWGRKSPE